MNNKNILDALEAVDDEFILDAKEHKTMKKKAHWVRRIAISIAAVFVLAAVTMGAAMALNEDVRFDVYRSFDMMEQAQFFEFPNKVKLWIADELGLWSSHIYRQDWSEKDGVYVGMHLELEPLDVAKNTPERYHDGKIYVIKHTWSGFEVAECVDIEEAVDEPMTLGMVSTKDVTVVYGQVANDSEAIGKITSSFGAESAYMKYNAAILSDGTICGLLHWGNQQDPGQGIYFMAVAWGDHRGAAVTDIARVDNWDGAIVNGHITTGDEWKDPDFEPEISDSYVGAYGALPEIVTTK